MKSKIIPIILLMLVIFTFAMTSSAFALNSSYFYSADYGSNSFFVRYLPSEVDQKLKYIYIFTAPTSANNTYEVAVYATDYKLILTKVMDSNSNGEIRFEDGLRHNIYMLRSRFNINDLEDNTKTINNSLYCYSNFDSLPTSAITMIDGNISPMYSNTDLTYNGSVVFQVAPQVEEQAKIPLSMDFSMVMAEILVLLPIVLIVLIGLLALRKAISLLLEMVRKA